MLLRVLAPCFWHACAPKNCWLIDVGWWKLIQPSPVTEPETEFWQMELWNRLGEVLHWWNDLKRMETGQHVPRLYLQKQIKMCMRFLHQYGEVEKPMIGALPFLNGQCSLSCAGVHGNTQSIFPILLRPDARRRHSIRNATFKEDRAVMNDEGHYAEPWMKYTYQCPGMRWRSLFVAAAKMKCSPLVIWLTKRRGSVLTA